MNTFKITDDGKTKTSDILKQMRKKFDVYVWFDEKTIDKEFPKPKKSTTRYFKKNIEADEELQNKSANDLEKEGIEGITLRERLLMELNYFNETGKHLDIDNVTLCSGSRSSDGSVPDVRWGSDSREVGVDCCRASSSYPNLRSRAAATLEPSTLNPLESRIKSLESDMEKIKKFLII